MKEILWLSSWYPNKKEPYEGDFIQRHAKAVSRFMPVTVIHVTQYGEKIESTEDRIEVRKEGNLSEIVVYFRFRRIDIALIDKIRYNRKFFSLYKKIIRDHFRQNGSPGLVHLHIPMKAGIIARHLKKKYHLSYILTEHSTAYYNDLPGNFFSRSSYYKNAVRKIFSHAACITSVSKDLDNRLRAIFKFSNSSVIYNVVDTKLFCLQPQPKKFRFIHASTMIYRKNVEGILRCLSGLKNKRSDWDMVMLGWDSPQLKRLSTELGLDQFINWKGAVSYPEVAKEMQQSSALLMFSRHENFPCTIIEALCCGLPVISSSVGGIPEVINETNGVLIESENETQLLGALYWMIDNYSKFDRKKIAEFSQTQFNYQNIGKQFISLYEKFIHDSVPSST